jgi:hypothetical protein
MPSNSNAPITTKRPHPEIRDRGTAEAGESQLGLLLTCEDILVNLETTWPVLDPMRRS